MSFIPKPLLLSLLLAATAVAQGGPASQPASRPHVALAEALDAARAWVERPVSETRLDAFGPAADIVLRVYDQPRPQRVWVSSLDTTSPGIRFTVTEPAPSKGDGGKNYETLCETTLAFARRVNCQLAVNTSAFSPLRPEPGMPMDLSGLAAHRGSVFSQAHKDFGAMCISREGRIALTGPPLDTHDVWDVVPGFRMLIDDGRIALTEEELNTGFGGPNPRTAVGADKSGGRLWIVVADGRQKGCAEGLTLAELACVFERLGVWDALNLDGGGSTTFVMHDAEGNHRVFNSPIHGGVRGELRQVGANLGVQLPGPGPAATSAAPCPVHAWIRVNQVGYLPDDPKIAILSSDEPVTGEFKVGEFRAQVGADCGPWGPFRHNYRLDFTAVTKSGRYRIRAADTSSPEFAIGPDAYRGVPGKLLDFMRLQRCGDNPVTGQKCHQQDAIDSETGKRLDLVGGWHDAADRIKHMITTSYCVAALELGGAKEEALYGTDLLLKIHPDPNTVYVQIGDDRDHGPPERLWHEDATDYGWGPGSARPAWPALGKPQGPKYQNVSTGVASLAGRTAAALALAGRLDAARSLYRLAKAKPGCAMSIPVKAPYYYQERSYFDDLEWAAAELYLATREPDYLRDAVAYARRAGASDWMGQLRHGHYECFPYVNLAHWRLYPHVDAAVQLELAGFYRTGLERVRALADKNSYRLGTPLVWCSTNDVIAFATQAVLYEHMTGDRQFRGLAAEARDWIFGRNPWGVSFVIGVPAGGDFASRPHHLMHKLAGTLPVGGLVDGPVYKDINDSLKFAPFGDDRLARFQSDVGVYHDAYADFSTNEPIIDCTVSLLLLLRQWEAPSPEPSAKYTYDEGGIVLGDRREGKLALVFTGGEYGEGANPILDTLARRGIKASFFLTGQYLSTPAHQSGIRRMNDEGHYVGPHSHAHLLYCDWQDRRRNLVTKDEFKTDLKRNVDELRGLGALSGDTPVFFIPPYEYYNADQVRWAKDLNVVLFNFTPGPGTHRDWIPEGHPGFVPSAKLVEEALDFERRNPNGFRGAILLMHLGSQRQDKMHLQLEPLVEELTRRGYGFGRIDELLSPTGPSRTW